MEKILECSYAIIPERHSSGNDYHVSQGTIIRSFTLIPILTILKFESKKGRHQLLVVPIIQLPTMHVRKYMFVLSNARLTLKHFQCYMHLCVILFDHAEPTYQEITPKVKVTAPARRRSKSGGATRNVIFVDNPLYEHSQSLPPPRKGTVEKNMLI